MATREHSIEKRPERDSIERMLESNRRAVQQTNRRSGRLEDAARHSERRVARALKSLHYGK